MILKTNEMKISSDFKKGKPSLNITKRDIDALNNRIKNDIAHNEAERRGTKATFPHNKDREL